MDNTTRLLVLFAVLLFFASCTTATRQPSKQNVDEQPSEIKEAQPQTPTDNPSNKKNKPTLYDLRGLLLV